MSSRQHSDLKNFDLSREKLSINTSQPYDNLGPSKILGPEFEIRKSFDFSERADGKGNSINKNHIAPAKGNYISIYNSNHIGGQVADETMPVWDKRVVSSDLALPLGFVLENSFAKKLRDNSPAKCALTERGPDKCPGYPEIM